MCRDSQPLSDDIEALKALLVEQRVHNAQLETDKQAAIEKNTRLHAQILTLQEQLNLALAKRYASSSEKCSPDQLRLFDEAEVDATPVEDARLEPVTVAAHASNKRGRKPLPETLARVDVIHELNERERICPHDGKVLNEIGDVISEQLDLIPAQIRVLRHVRKKYACTCGQCIKTAPLPPQPILKSLASPGLLVHITVCKYQDALPLYRQETILKRIGVDVPRATLANWMINAGTLIQPLINLLRDRLLIYDII